MNKQEFLEKLRMALSGKVSPGVVTENINYYEDYINMEVRKGRSEEDVLASLGDPRLIARTIVETSGDKGAGSVNGAGRSTGAGGFQGAGGTYYGQHTGEYGENGYSRRGVPMRAKVSIILMVVIVLAVAALIIGAVFSVLTFLLPVLLPILVISLLVKLFRDWLN